MKPDEVFSVWALRAAGEPRYYLPGIAACFGSLATAVFVSHFIYWDGKQEDEAEQNSEWTGWIYKRAADISRDTALGRYEIERARKILCHAGVLEEKLAGIPARNFYRFNWNRLSIVITEWKKSQSEPKAKGPKSKRKTKPGDPTVEGLGFESAHKRMIEVFDDRFSKKNPIGYTWRDQDFANLKLLRENFINRLKSKEMDVTDDNIVKAFEFFLDSLREYHIKTWFTVPDLLKNFNRIINDLNNDFKKSSSNKNESAQSDGSEYVRSEVHQS